MHLDCTQSGQMPASLNSGLHPARHATLGYTHPLPQGGVPSACEALAGRLEFASIVDVDPEVRAALATLGGWLRTGEFGSAEIARWLVGTHRDVW